MNNRLLLLLLPLLLVGACKPKPVTVEGPGYVVEAAAAGGQLIVFITSTMGRHVNEKYPFTFEGSTVAVIDKEEPLQVLDVMHATYKAHYTLVDPNAAEWKGTFKLSICTEEACQIEDVKMALPLR